MDPESVDNLLTPYYGEPCSVHGNASITLEAAASTSPPPTQHNVLSSTDVTSNDSASSHSWSTPSSPDAATNSTSPSNAIVMLSTSHDQHAAASAMPAIRLEDIDRDSVVPVPAELSLDVPIARRLKFLGHNSIDTSILTPSRITATVVKVKPHDVISTATKTHMGKSADTSALLQAVHGTFTASNADFRGVWITRRDISSTTSTIRTCLW